jgi:hypothetical protein
MKTALAAALAVALAACSPASIAPPADAGSGTGATGDGGTSAEADQACKDYAYARCTRVDTCSPTAILIQFGSVATCEAYYHQTCDYSLSVPSTNTTSAHTTACTAALPGWACSDIIFGENTPPACATLAGTLANGASCAVSGQCQSAWCARPYGSACGRCSAPPTAGAACVVASECGPGLTCFNGACEPHAPLGAQCGPTSPCDDGLTCVSGVCAAGGTTPGAACSPTGAGCDVYAGLACNAQSGTCQTLQVVPGGQACGEVANQNQTCMAGNCVRGACVAGAALGAPCLLDGINTCISFAECIATTDGGTNGTCQIPGTACH